MGGGGGGGRGRREGGGGRREKEVIYSQHTLLLYHLNGLCNRLEWAQGILSVCMECT